MRKYVQCFLASVVVGGLLFSVITGCNSSTNAKAPATASDNSILYKVLKNGKLTVGMCLFIQPTSYYDDTGKPVGYDVDVAQALADSLGVKLQIVDLAADARVSSLETGKVDIVLAQFTRTLERAQKIDFSDPYTASGPLIAVKKDSAISSLSDLKNGKQIAVTTGSSHEAMVKAEFPNSKIVYFSTTAEGTIACKNGQVDACVDDANVLNAEIIKSGKLKSLGTPEGYVDYNCIGTIKGDQIWLNYLNDFVFTINSNGKNKKLYKNWFGSDMSISLKPQY